MLALGRASFNVLECDAGRRWRSIYLHVPACGRGGKVSLDSKEDPCAPKHFYIAGLIEFIAKHRWVEEINFVINGEHDRHEPGCDDRTKQPTKTQKANSNSCWLVCAGALAVGAGATAASALAATGDGDGGEGLAEKWARLEQIAEERFNEINKYGTAGLLALLVVLLAIYW